MPKIPVAISDTPTSRQPLPEEVEMEVMIVDCQLNGASDEGEVYGKGPDKNGNDYLSCSYEIQTPEEVSGAKVFDNYIALPRRLSPGADSKERRRAANDAVKFGQWARCFGVKDNFDTDEVAGSAGKITVKNEEYQGDTIPRVKNYLF